MPQPITRTMTRVIGSTPGQRRHLRRVSRRRRRGGDNRAPIPLQRIARRVEDTTFTARHVGAKAVAGDRPFIVALVVVLALALMMLSAPFQRYLDGRDRVASIEAKLTALNAQNAQLSTRVDALNEPGEVEVLARERQGLIFPGEVPFAVVPPDAEGVQITSPRDAELVPLPWYERMWDSLTSGVGAG